MQPIDQKLLSTQQIDVSSLHRLFDLSKKIKTQIRSVGKIDRQLLAPLEQRIAYLVFFEPSTRTRMSFETACFRTGLQSSVFSGQKNSSLEKGETLLDTLKVLEAMGPDVIILRHSGHAEVEAYIENQSSIKYINAGCGSQAHPTQALLDAFTMQERLGELKGKNVLFLGDVRHSRVANSNLNLLRILESSVGICAPEEFQPTANAWNTDVQKFEKLQPALEWADVCMVLRPQKERHAVGADENFSKYIRDYQLNQKTMGWLKPSALIMHPGPFVPDEEITMDAVNDSRSVILDQVENGVYMRASLLINMFQGANS